MSGADIVIIKIKCSVRRPSRDNRGTIKIGGATWAAGELPPHLAERLKVAL